MERSHGGSATRGRTLLRRPGTGRVRREAARLARAASQANDVSARGVLCVARVSTGTAALSMVLPVGNRERWLLEKRLQAVLVRSEEHTSELQLLMRISYAVFCLQKTINPTI